MLHATRSARAAVNSVPHCAGRTWSRPHESSSLSMSYQSLEDEDVHSNEDDELEGLQREMSAPATYVPSLFLVLTVHSRRYFHFSFHTGATSFITAICSLDIFTFCIMRSPKHRSQPLGTRSLYALSKSEVTKNIANRFVHSRSYVILYLAMASLSTATVILSLQDGCPGFAFYILEIIINVAMIAEVSIRFIAFGQVRCISQHRSFRCADTANFSNSGNRLTTWSTSG